MNAFATADTHFSHRNIIKYCHRPFLSADDAAELARRGGNWHRGTWKDGPSWKISDEAVELMDHTLIVETNKIVGRNDIMIHVGDFGLRPNKAKDVKNYFIRCKRIREQIKCQNIHLVKGNHDDDCIAELFSSYSRILERDFFGKHIVFCHNAFLTWPRSHRGALHVYGHSHSELEEWSNLHMVGRRSIDCGVDNAVKLLGAYRPFNIKTEIVDVLSARRGFSSNPHTPTDDKSPEEGELS